MPTLQGSTACRRVEGVIACHGGVFSVLSTVAIGNRSRSGGKALESLVYFIDARRLHLGTGWKPVRQRLDASLASPCQTRFARSEGGISLLEVNPSTEGKPSRIRVGCMSRCEYQSL